jgi:hypothetical protein
LKGRKAEDGKIDPKYPLEEFSSASYLQRTEWNVRDSDATAIFSLGAELTGGSKKKRSTVILLHNKALVEKDVVSELIRRLLPF